MNVILNKLTCKYPDIKDISIRNLISFLEFKKEYAFIYNILLLSTIYDTNDCLYKYYIKYSIIFNKEFINTCSPNILENKDKFHMAIISIYLNNCSLFDLVYTKLDLSINYTNKWLTTILHYTLIYDKPLFFKKAIKLGVNPYINNCNEILLTILDNNTNQEIYIQALAESKFKPVYKRDPVLLKKLSKCIKKYSLYKIHRFTTNIGYEYSIKEITKGQNLLVTNFDSF